MINLQVYQQAKAPAKKQAGTYMPLPGIAPPDTVGQFLHPYPGYQNQYSYIPQMVPIVNNFKIETNGPLDNHARLSMLYEDILPSKQFMTSVNTLDERIHMYEFVRSVLIKDKDNSDIMVFSNNYNTLLNYIKFMDLNPYNTDVYSSNPYQGLPIDMLLYRSCYPIKYNSTNSSVMCSKNSIGVNIRIYKISDEELQIFYNKNDGAAQQQALELLVRQGEIQPAKGLTKKISDYDIWREVTYYEYVRENIIKKKISPNFVIMYSFNLVLTPFIDFNRLAYLRGSVSKQEGKYKGKSLILITESPTHNLYGWASNSYQIHNNIQKMVYTGFYSEKIWYGILFQLMASLYTMQKYGFIFHDFSVEDNVYVKDLKIDDTNIKYWKYKIDNVDYFIPNYGYLVMLDSKYKDIKQNKILVDKVHKVYGNFLEEYDKDDVYNRCFEALEHCFSQNVFSKAFMKNGGVLPPDRVMNFITFIHTQISNYRNKTKEIGFYIRLCMTRFMHNRIGTILKTPEVQYIRNDDRSKFFRGQIVVHEYSNKNYKFVMFDEIDQESPGNYNVFYKENPDDTDIISTSIPFNKLYNYSAMESIQQDYKAGEVNFNEESMLETYRM